MFWPGQARWIGAVGDGLRRVFLSKRNDRPGKLVVVRCTGDHLAPSSVLGEIVTIIAELEVESLRENGTFVHRDPGRLKIDFVRC